MQFEFENPALEAAVRQILQSGIGIADEDLGEIANAQIAFEQDLAELEAALDKPEAIIDEQTGIDVNPQRDTDIQTILSALDVFVTEGPGGFLESMVVDGVPDIAATVPSPETEPDDPGPEDEEETMSSFNPWGILDVITGVFEDAGPGDVFGPDLFDVIQLGTGIAGLFQDQPAGVAAVNGSQAMAAAPRTITPLQVVQACSRRKTGRSISKKNIKAMARVCGLDQTANTLGCPVTSICLVVASPTRRRTGISSADMRKTRSTIRKVKNMYMSIPTRSSPRRKS